VGRPRKSDTTAKVSPAVVEAVEKKPVGRPRKQSIAPMAPSPVAAQPSPSKSRKSERSPEKAKKPAVEVGVPIAATEKQGVEKAEPAASQLQQQQQPESSRILAELSRNFHMTEEEIRQELTQAILSTSGQRTGTTAAATSTSTAGHGGAGTRDDEIIPPDPVCVGLG